MMLRSVNLEPKLQQLDLFLDSVPIQRANILIEALTRLDGPAASKALQDLIAADPEFAGLPHFALLCAFVDHWHSEGRAWPGTREAVMAVVRSFQEQILPATSILGSASGPWSQNRWADLARASETANIGPECRDCYAAELYLRAQQYREVVRTSGSLAGAMYRADVQRWLALGYQGCESMDQSRDAALRYSWLAPEAFGRLVTELGNALLMRDWRTFQADLGDLDATWFPAWCAHEGKVGSTLLDSLPEGDGPRAYQLVLGLMMRERSGLGPVVYQDRARLKRLNETFFAFYMQRRADIHCSATRSFSAQ